MKNCEIHNCSDDGVRGDQGLTVVGCYIHNCGGRGIEFAGHYGHAYRNIIGDFESPSNTMTTAIGQAGGSNGCAIIDNIIFGTTTGFIGIQQELWWHIVNNSIYNSAAGTASGINIADGISRIFNNLVEGFNGSGGAGIDFNGFHTLYLGNAVDNNGTDYLATHAHTPLNLGDNESLSASPFNISGSVTPADFIPADTGNVKQGSQPHTIVGTP